MSKTAFVATGHGEGDPGAVAAGYEEHKLAGVVAGAMVDRLKSAGVSTIADPGVRDVPARIRVQAARANDQGAGLAVQIHLNSFSDPRAHGSEVWIYAPGGEREAWAKKLAAALGTIIPSRGVKSGHYTFLGATVMPATIVEVGFISNDGDRAIIIARGREIGRILADATLDHLGVPHPAEPAPAPDPRVLYRVYADEEQRGAFHNLENVVKKVKELLRKYRKVKVVKGES